jgi:hypothetical protein
MSDGTHRRVLKEIPRFTAMTLVAPGERFNALAIFLTPCLSLAMAFNVRRSSLVHARRTTFFLFLAFTGSLRTGILFLQSLFVMCRRWSASSTLGRI